MSELRERIERALHNVEYTAGEAAASMSSVAETLREALALLPDEPEPVANEITEITIHECPTCGSRVLRQFGATVRPPVATEKPTEECPECGGRGIITVAHGETNWDEACPNCEPTE